jgi:DNA-binding LytR/AlgR family response regulator
MTSLNPAHWLDVARWLALYPSDTAIKCLLGHMGELLDADRTWVFRYDAKLDGFIQTYKWVREGCLPTMEDLQELPAASLQGLHEVLQCGRMVHFPDISWFAGDAQELKQRMIRHGIRAVVAVPIFANEQLAGILGQDSEHDTREWSEEACATLKTTAEIIGGIFAKESSLGPAPAPAQPRPVLYAVQGNGVVSLPQEQILHISSDRNHSCLHTVDGRKFDGLRALSEWENLLPPENFTRVHRSHLVNIGRIARLDRTGGAWRLWLADGVTSLPVGRPHRFKMQKLLLPDLRHAMQKDAGDPRGSSNAARSSSRITPFFLRPLA